MSSGRKESERTKLIQEKCQTILTLMLRDEDNKYCVDCDAKGPRWASWNLGVFLCIRCAGIHRNLGVHISRVKSVNLDSWTPEQVVSLQQMGNSRARAVYEAQMPDGYRRPQTDSALESFIRAKYEQKKFVAREWRQPSPVKVSWDKEIDEELEKQKRKKKGLSMVTPASNGKISDTPKTNSAYKSIPIPAPLPKPTNNSNSPKISSRIPSSSTPATTTATVEANKSETKSYSSDLLGLSTPVNGPPEPRAASVDTDVFGYFMSEAPAAAPSIKTNASPSASGAASQSGPEPSLAQQEQDFFNQMGGGGGGADAGAGDKDKGKMTKDSILALYGVAPTINRMPSISNQFMGQAGMPAPLNNDFAGLTTQFRAPQPHQQTAAAFAARTHNPNSFAAFGMAPATGQQQAMNFQATMTNTMPSQGLAGFPNLMQSTPNAAFVQQNANVMNMGFPAPATQPANVNNVNQQFGSLNLGNVWQ